MSFKRICVIGASGSGKSFVARALSERLGLHYIESDQLIWRANWEPVPRDEQYVAFDKATAGGEWVFDGNLGPSAEDVLVLSRADAIVWVDLPRWRVMQSVAWRSLRRAFTRQQLWHGNVETLGRLFSRDSIVLWAWRSYPRTKRRYTRLFDDAEHAHLGRVRLTSRKDVNRWLAAPPGGLEGS